MSSPLSPKRDNVFNSRSASPAKSGPLTPAKRLPVKLPKLNFTLTPSKQQPLFTIYEDKPEERALYHKATDSSDDVQDDKENILQPKVMALPQAGYTHRQPLANLSIAEFAGYVSCAGLLRKGSTRLHRLYQPKNYTNESRTTHKYNGLPSYITPPRNAMAQILHRSANEEDDLERRLIAKLREVMRRKRAMSVGVNKGKAHLVTKNTFKIFTN